MTTYKAREENSPYRYFTMIPNMAEDDLDPFEYRLLAHFVRWAGQGGTENKSLRQIAEATRISVTKVRATLKALADKGYIEVRTPNEAARRARQSTTITVLDVWGTNIARYAKKATVPDLAQSEGVSVPDLAQSTVPDLAQLEERLYEERGEGKTAPPQEPQKPAPADVDAAIYDTPRTVRAPRQFHEYGPKAILNPVVRMERSMQTTHELYTAYAEQFKTPPPAPTRADLDAAWWAEDNGYTPAHIAKATAHRLKAGRGSSAFKFIIMDIHTLLQDSGPVLELVGAAAPAAPEQPAARMTRAEVDALIKQGQQAEQEKKSA